MYKNHVTLFASLILLLVAATWSACSENPSESCDLECVNGSCTLDENDEPSCNCFEGYEGELCDQEGGTDPCADQPCQNDGSCTADGDSFECECTEGFEGDLCEDEVQQDPCADEPCANGGSCTADGESFECECTESFTGEFCEEAVVGACDDNPCQNDATCIEEGDDAFTCECADVWTSGQLCECDGVSTVVSEVPQDTDQLSMGHFIGFEFVPEQDLRITQLGVVNSVGTDQQPTPGEEIEVDGLGAPAPVGIYDSDGLLVSATVEPGDPLADGYRWRQIDPVQLESGETYVLLAVLTGDNYFSYQSDDISYDDVIVSQGFRGYNTDGATELPDTPPENENSWSDQYFGPSFTYESCPE